MESDLRLLLKEVDAAGLGARLKAARLRAGLTQSEVGGPDASIAYVSRIESGQRRPDVALLTILAARLGTTAEALVLGIGGDERSGNEVQLDYAELALATGEHQRALDLTADLLERTAHVPDADFRRRTRLVQALALEATGESEAAIDVFDELIARAPTPDSPLVTRAVIALCRCHREAGDASRAIAVGDAHLAVLQRDGLGASDEAIELTSTVASAYFQRGDVAHAVRMCRRAAAIAEETNSPRARAAIYWNASVMQSESGQTRAALPLARQALALLHESGHQRGIARLRAQIGAMQLKLDPPDLAAAIEDLEQAERDFESCDVTPIDKARNRLHMAQAHHLAGDLAAAEALNDAVLTQIEGLSPILEADALMLRGQLLAHRDLEAARASYLQAALRLSSGEDLVDRHLAQLWLDLAGLFQASGLATEALDAYQRSAAASGLTMPAQRLSLRAP